MERTGIEVQVAMLVMEAVSSLPIEISIPFLYPIGDIVDSKLWFVSDGANLAGVFNSRHDAEREERRSQDDLDYDYFEYYGVDTDDFEDYPEEYDLAVENGYI